MWNLTPDYLANIKEELKGRRAAIQARYADEVKSIEADLEEIEMLERMAYAFAVKHLPEPEAPPTEAENEADEGDGSAKLAALHPSPGDGAADDRGGEGKAAMSRWRMRLETRADTDAAEETAR